MLYIFTVNVKSIYLASDYFGAILKKERIDAHIYFPYPLFFFCKERGAVHSYGLDLLPVLLVL